MFKIRSKFQPTGDQPEAIKKLAKGLKSGVRNQVLLGVTGSGKSVTAETPVFIRRDKEITCRPIGQLIDKLFQKYSPKIVRLKESEILSINQEEEKINFEAFSLNPVTKQSEWKPVSQLIRHRSPKNIYQIQTLCGREITVTNDHNFWVLRRGSLVLLPTNQIKKTDYIPLPTEIPKPGKGISHLDLFEILKGEKLFVDAKPLMLKVLSEKKPVEITQAMSKYYVFPWQKLYQIKSGVYHGMTFAAISQVAQDLNINFSCENINKVAIGSQIHRYTLPGKIPLTKEWLKLIGYYIAEGHGEPKSRFFTLTAAHPVIQKEFKNIFNKLKLGYSQEKYKKIDFSISSKIHAFLLAKICGTNARSKKLPDFWPSLSQKQLSILLRAYFTGDGGAFPAQGQVVATTASKQLASDLTYALLRFRIWTRISRRWQKALNSPQHKGDYYYYLTVSGKENLKNFKKYIDFELLEKQNRLNKLIVSSNTTNVDVILGIGPTIKDIRKKLQIMPQRVFAKSCKLSAGTLNAIEIGINNPRRETFKKIVDAFLICTKTSKEINELKNLLNCKWTKVAEIKKVSSKEFYVYDFAVKDNETFLAGFGGLFVHNTFTAANVIKELQRPVLWISHNKSLAAQTFQELKNFFPQNAVHYFVSYYDYYQPEAYMPQTDTYIEKDAKINEEIDRLRHAATQDLITRDDVIVVASVSCIYNIGSPEDYQNVSLSLEKGQTIKRRDLISHLTSLQYVRNEFEQKPGTFRVRGDVIEVYLVTGQKTLKIELEKDKVISPSCLIFPAHFWVAPQNKINIALANIRSELNEQLKKLSERGKLLERQRLEQRTNYDIEMLKESGFCHGIENYSRHLEFRRPGEAPFTLIDYFKKDFLVFIDESHMTVPQLNAMYNTDKSRKEVLIEHGFRLPSALDNRPLKFQEFEKKIKQAVFVSATPGPYEKEKAGKKSVVEQIIRPTGLLEPAIKVRPTKNQIKDLIAEIKQRAKRNQRTLVVTLTKRLAEALSDHLSETGIKTNYLHSEIKTLERPAILQDFRSGKYDVVVGINLLREGLDLPEVSLVAILDADKEGFLRNETTLIQTMGRAARHSDGTVIMYADKETLSMKKAIKEIERRREIQKEYNKKHGITPKAIQKAIQDWPFALKKKEVSSEFFMIHDRKLLEKEMKTAARNLDFERAAEIRDLIKGMKDDKDKTYAD